MRSRSRRTGYKECVESRFIPCYRSFDRCVDLLLVSTVAWEYLECFDESSFCMTGREAQICFEAMADLCFETGGEVVVEDRRGG